jgi:hypothetical protein
LNTPLPHAPTLPASRRLLIVALTLALLINESQAGFGYVETRDDRKHEGEITLAHGMFCIADTNFLATNYVRLEELSALRMHMPTNTSAPPRTVELVNGSILTRKIHLADETAIRFSKSSKDPALSTASVARILLHDTPVDGRQPGRRGLLLHDRDFIDGEFRSLKDGKVRISSVIFGARTFPAEKVAAIFLRDPIAATCRFEIRTHDNSLWRAKEIAMAGNELVVRDPLLPEWRFKMSGLLEVRRNGK